MSGNPESVRPPSRAPQRLRDTALYVGAVFFTAVALTNVPAAQDGDSVSDAGALLWLLALGAWVTVFFRRQVPWVTTIAGFVLALFGIEYLLFLFGVYQLLLHARRPALWWIGGGATGVVTLFWVREALTDYGSGLFELEPAPAITVSGITALVSLGVCFGTVAIVSSRKAASAASQQAAEGHNLAAQLGDELARQAERNEIAREIHDGLTNRLALLSMMGGNVERAVDRGDPQAQELARQLQSQSRAALTDLRGLVQDLRTSPTTPPAPRQSMRGVNELISSTRTAGTSIDAVVMLEGMETAPAVLDAAVFRLTQEALTNAVKHAPASPISLYLEASPQFGVRLRVTNALGPAITDAEGAGAGVVGIRERVKALSGEAWIGRHEGEFIVDVTLPWSTADTTSEGMSGPSSTVGA
ncbi:histidine kinase [Demequina sp. B12]|uniref:sensor histidine kinase n=1 Tax=Demequina sp. B12 TaxID=2992757 RepID=UPI00237A3BFE|nr:histidine kinase [Demequina sp. B12]MDE0572248.1 histidine kinase [Demequina sp. B12]